MKIFSPILTAALTLASVLHVGAEEITLSQSPAVTEHNIDLQRMMPVRSGVSSRSLQSPRRTPRLVAPRPGFEVCGSVIGADTWGTSSASRLYGVYSATVAGESTLKVNPIKLDNRLNATTGAVMTPQGYYVIHTTPYMGYYLVDHYLFDPTDWSLLSKKAADMESMARSLAYNPADGKVYGSFANLDGSFSFSSLDITTGDRKKIAVRMENPYSALAADNSGRLYGIDNEGSLVSIDLKTGSPTLLHSVGLPSVYTTSAIYDAMSGNIIYVQAREDASELFSIDPVEGTVLSLGEFADGQQWGGLYIAVAEAADGAPGIASGLSCEFEGKKLSGIITFTAPTTLFDGSSAETPMSWTLSVGERILTSGECQPGECVKAAVEVEQPGVHAFYVRLSNDAGVGPTATVSAAVGPDLPEEISTPSFEYDFASSTSRLSWKAPAKGANGGWFDASALTYDIVRYPSGATVASGVSLPADTATGLAEWNEPLPDPESLTVISYGIIPTHEGRKGEETRSNSVALGEISLPYDVDFRQPAVLDAFHVEDANGDGITWTPDEKHSAYVDYSHLQMNDWLITAPVLLEKGMVYTVTVDAWSQSVRHDERIAVWLGQGMDSGKMTKRLTSRSLDGHPDPAVLQVTVEETGLYNFGLQGCSPAGQYVLRLGAFSISAPVAQTAPQAPRFISIQPAFGGELSLTGRVMVPLKATDGSTLTNVTSLTVTRDNEPIYTIENPTPGQVLTFADTPAAAGAYAYEAVAASEAGFGVAASVNAYVGVNVPANPMNVTLQEAGEETVLTWTRSSKGADGLQLNTADVLYHVYDAEFREIGVTDENIISIELPAAREPFVTIYYVRAETEAGLNPMWDASTGLLNRGEPADGILTLPWSGSLNERCVGMAIADGLPAGRNPWEEMIPVSSPAMNHIPFLEAVSQEGEDGAALILPAVTIGEEAPVLRFTYVGELKGTRIIVYIIEGQNIIPVEVDPSTYPTTSPYEFAIPLNDFSGHTVNPAIVFLGTGPFALEEATVEWRQPVDVRLTKFLVPGLAPYGTVSMYVDVANAGSQDVGPFDIYLEGFYKRQVYQDDIKLLAEERVDGLTAGENKTITFRLPFEQYRDFSISAYARLGDIPGNDQRYSRTQMECVSLVDRGYAYPRSTKATAMPGGSVRVEWTEPKASDSMAGALAPEIKLTGYKVYADHVKIGETDVETRMFQHIPDLSTIPAEGRDIEYTVVACYGDHESMPGNPAYVFMTEVSLVVDGADSLTDPSDRILDLQGRELKDPVPGQPYIKGGKVFVNPGK